MQDFFNHMPNVHYSVTRYAQWEYFREGLQRNLNTVKTYYTNRVFTVRSNHFLVKLLNTINVPFSLDLERFYDNIDGRALNLSMVMKMTSSIYRGYLFSGVFYGNDNPEIIITDSGYFNPFEVDRNWKTVCSVKPILHPKSDLDMFLPNGKSTSNENGLAVISINIPMLAIQYRAFLREEMRKLEDNVEHMMLTTAHFVHMYILPNMMDAHLDIAIYNRFKNIVNGAPMGESTRKHAFAMVDYSKGVTKVQNQMYKDIEGKTLNYHAIMKTVPLVVFDTLDKILVLPDNVQTRQVLWSEVLARLDSLDMLIELGGKQSLGINRAELNYFLRFFKMLSSDRSLDSYLPADMLFDVKYQIAEIIKKIK